MQLTSDMAISIWPWSLYLSLIFHILTSSFKLFKIQWDNSWEGIYEAWNAKPLWVMGTSWVISAVSAKWLDDLHPYHRVGCRSLESRTEGVKDRGKSCLLPVFSSICWPWNCRRAWPLSFWHVSPCLFGDAPLGRAVTPQLCWWLAPARWELTGCWQA